MSLVGMLTGRIPPIPRMRRLNGTWRANFPSIGSVHRDRRQSSTVIIKGKRSLDYTCEANERNHVLESM
jgi:hypothetical protein